MMNLKDMTLEELFESYNKLKQKQDEDLDLISQQSEKYHWEFLSSNEFEKLESKLEEINDEKKKVEKIIMLKKEPMASNDKIDLRKKGDQINDRYYIFIHNTDICVGIIEYRGYHCNPIIGDIGYNIYEQYRRHGYASEALKLLGNLLQKNEIDSIWITVSKNNIPSIKTIEKCGVQLTKEHENGVLQYECKTLSIDLEESKIIKGGNYGRIK